MSTYSRVTRHPNTKHYALADWCDDYFGPHRYGVKFPDDPVVYPAEQVNEAQLKTFWVADVIEAWLNTCNHADPDKNQQLIAFLQLINKTYKRRWKRDPVGGEGAIKWLRELRGDDDTESEAA